MREASMPSSVKAIVSICLVIFILTSVPASAMGGASGSAVDPSPLPPSITNAPFSVNQVVTNLIRKDEDRARRCAIMSPTAFITFPIVDSPVIATPR